MSRRALGAAVLFSVLSVPFGPCDPTSASPLPVRTMPNTDAELRHDVDRLLTNHTEGQRDTLISIEVLADDTTVVERVVNRVGGTVTGAVEGYSVQALVPAGAVDALAGYPAVDFVQLPIRVNRIPPIEGGFGPVVGQEAALVNATAWHDVGITGDVRVGIIDFFDLNAWNRAEHGPAPDAAHQFCLGAGLCLGGLINPAQGDRHGVAVAEIVKDVAPGAELFLATTSTTAETQAAIDWFVANGVHIVTRSLGAPYDGPGDGTGPLDAVVDYAVARGITWFNSGGNDAATGYGRFTNGVDGAGFVDFDNGPGVDTVLRIDPQGGGVAFDGVRWANDWHLQPQQVTDYSVEVWQGTSESSRSLVTVLSDSQPAGAHPLELIDFGIAVPFGQALFLRIHADARYSPSEPDTVEVATFIGAVEAGRQTAAYSSAKPVVDSRSPALLAVGAIDPADGAGGIAFYSSQGPTNDGRIKPDISAPSCVVSTIYAPCFNGTSAASPAAAGMAALLLGRGLAVPGVPLAALTRHLVRDLGPAGPDNAFGAGQVLLPAPPVAVSSQPTTFSALASPARLLDTRPTSFVGPPNLIGPHPQFAIIDLPISTSGVIPPTATSIAVNVTSTDSVTSYYVQALPTLGGAVGAFSTANISAVGQIKPNFAIVPLGQGAISVYIPNGGNVIVDAMGYFTPSGPTATAGRFVPLNPSRVLDTRPTEPGPVPAGWTAHRPAPGEAVRVEVPASAGVPLTGVSALVVNVTATQPLGGGFLQATPTGGAVGQTSNVNYTTGETSATHAIVPLGAGGTISVFTSNASHIVVDIMGYITDGSAPDSSIGRFVPITPDRYYDSRNAPNSIHPGLSTVSIPLAGGPLAIPTGAAAISMNLTSDQAVGAGFVTAYPGDGTFPVSSNLNYVAATPVANAGLVKLSAAGTLNAFVNVSTHVIIDANGYFTGTQ